MNSSAKPTRDGPYHHGDLRNALVDAAAELAETGGPEAVTVRAAARRVGVTPTAAYRHFANHDQLLQAAHEQAQQNLFGAISQTLAALPPDAHPIRRLDAAGRGYITFALREPGLFRTAFCVAETSDNGYLDAPAYLLLGEILDQLVEVGYTDPEDRPGAEFGAWSAVHGIAGLFIDDAMGTLDEFQREIVIQRVIELVRRGLGTGPEAHLNDAGSR
ncbi:TetR/AcrR family transcriptional regulator [Nocardia bovistercoris]|uniref:TetR/AcrR family transcriptional regulator n=1 Tax=Nocardia bovistercoris TaxID=2785916 RepID=A0A931N5Q6_9NOCA|nr:TetR/AcrR family transcriptional regulator [Nocardia bovistercoris]MBH0778913.1 TetR/AcrR family transcriptional regulator [Nocardia bovistercoris]